MKKILCLLLCAVMLFAVTGCKNAQGQETTAPPVRKAIQVGFGRTEITPELSVPMAGYGATWLRLSIAAKDPLLATCVAVTDETDNTILLLSQDLINSHWAEEGRAAISQATGVPAEQILIAATHTHSGPDQTCDNENIHKWKPDYLAQVVAAAEAAMADRSPAQAYTATAQLEKMNAVRHYRLENGTYAGDNFGSFKESPPVAHAEENDAQLQLIRFVREGKQSVVMVNWQAHPTLTGGAASLEMSADFIGSTRTAFEKETGDVMIYFTGAAGNQNVVSKMPFEHKTNDNNKYGALLSQDIIAALETVKTPSITTIGAKEITYTGNINHEMEDRLADAREVTEIYNIGGKAAANKLAVEKGFSSAYHANAIVRRSAFGATRDMKICALSIGDISFIAAPYEMFASSGRYIKDNSPFGMTFVITCCNGNNGYLPTEAAYDYGCYESHTCNFTKGTAEDLAKTYVSLLEALHKTEE